MKNSRVSRGSKAKGAKSPRNPYQKFDEKRRKPGRIRKKREAAVSHRKLSFSRQRERVAELNARRHNGDANA